MDDKLEILISKQAELQQALGYDISNMTELERVNYIKEYTQHLDGEMFEMLRELPHFKAWKRYPEDTAVMFAKARCEWIDVLHFFLNVSIALGFTADEMFKMYCMKNHINYERQEDKVNYKPCLVGDDACD